MGKIFGISDNPVSTIESALRPLNLNSQKQYPKRISKPLNSADSFVSVKKQKVSNAFVKMRNGFRKLMPHFSQQKTRS